MDGASPEASLWCGEARHNVGHKHGSELDISEILPAIEVGDKILAALDSCFLD
jgi:hypothetical protein